MVRLFSSQKQFNAHQLLVFTKQFNQFNKMKAMKKLFNAIKRNMKVSAERGLMNCTGSIPLWAVQK